MKKQDYAKLFRQREDGRYIGKYKDENGKWHSLSDKDPERLYEKLENAKRPRAVTFADAAGAWESLYRESCNPRTWQNYRPHYEDIVDKYGTYPVEEITASMVWQDMTRAKAKGYSRTIVCTRRSIFNNILNYAVANEMLSYNQVGGLKLPKGLPSTKRSAPTDEMINTIIQNYEKPFGMFAFLLLCTGLRKGEALALLKSDFKHGEISVTKSLTLLDGVNARVKEPKSEAGKRTVPVLSILEQPLKEYMAKLDGDILFPNRSYNGSPGNTYMTESNYDTAWAHYCEQTGLVGLTAHQLRHGTATLLFEAGVDVYTAKKILGHAKVSTTMEIYTELREQKEKKSVAKLDDYLASRFSVIN